MFYTLKTAAGHEFGVSDDGTQVRIACAKRNVLEIDAATAKELTEWLATIKLADTAPAA